MRHHYYSDRSRETVYLGVQRFDFDIVSGSALCDRLVQSVGLTPPSTRLEGEACVPDMRMAWEELMGGQRAFWSFGLIKGLECF